jgi:hypothetical protein
MTTRSKGLVVTSPRTLAVLGAALVAGLAASAAPADAAVSSASISGPTATLNLDGADDAVAVTVAGGVLVHGQTTGGLATGADWDSTTAGEQTIPAAAATNVVINGGDGSDVVSVSAKTTELGAATLNGSSARRARTPCPGRSATTRSCGTTATARTR